MILELVSFAGALALPAYAPSAATPDSGARLLVMAAQSIGGEARLRALHSIRIGETGFEYMLGTPNRVGGPLRPIAQERMVLMNVEEGALRQTMTQRYVMFSGAVTSTVVASGGAASTIRDGAFAPASVNELIAAEEQLALSPERVLITGLDARQRRVDPDTVLSGVRFHVVTFPFADATVRLYLNADTFFPEQMLLVRGYPRNPYLAMWGDLKLRTSWGAWSMDSTGVWYPRQRSVTLNGTAYQEYAVTALSLNAAAPADSFAIPDSVRNRFSAQLAVVPATPSFTVTRVSDGVVLLQGGYQSVIVKQDDGVVILEAPESAAKARAVIAEAATLYPRMRIQAVVSTSPMWMHIAGLREYVARGIPVYGLDVNADEIRRLVAASHQTSPDMLASSKKALNLHVVSGATPLGRGSNRIVLRPAHGEHGSSMMLAYLPEKQILYASDLLIPPTFEPVFTSALREDLLRIVRRYSLDVETLLTIHLPVTPWKTVAAGS